MMWLMKKKFVGNTFSCHVFPNCLFLQSLLKKDFVSFVFHQVHGGMSLLSLIWIICIDNCTLNFYSCFLYICVMLWEKGHNALRKSLDRCQPMQSMQAYMGQNFLPYSTS